MNISIRDAVAAVKERIATACHKSGRRPEEVRLVAVTKRVAVERVREAAALGLNDFGENYIQEAKAKIEAFGRGISPPGPESEGPTCWPGPNWPKPESGGPTCWPGPNWPKPVWHMIGHIQGNKAKYVPALFDYVHSVDRWDLLEQLDRHGKPLSVLFEVNIAGEAQKSGTDPDGLKRMLDGIGALKHVKPVGLMTMPPWSDDPEKARPVFAALRELLGRINSDYGLAMKELSMGMSADFEIAIAEGASMVRVGTAIFGERS